MKYHCPHCGRDITRRAIVQHTCIGVTAPSKEATTTRRTA